MEYKVGDLIKVMKVTTYQREYRNIEGKTFRINKMFRDTLPFPIEILSEGATLQLSKKEVILVESGMNRNGANT